MVLRLRLEGVKALRVGVVGERVLYQSLDEVRLLQI